jgi:hypothetical protein
MRREGLVISGERNAFGAGPTPAFELNQRTTHHDISRCVAHFSLLLLAHGGEGHSEVRKRVMRSGDIASDLPAQHPYAESKAGPVRHFYVLTYDNATA